MSQKVGGFPCASRLEKHILLVETSCGPPSSVYKHGPQLWMGVGRVPGILGTHRLGDFKQAASWFQSWTGWSRRLCRILTEGRPESDSWWPLGKRLAAGC